MFRNNALLAVAFVTVLSRSAAGEVAILQIQVVEGEAAVHAPGSLQVPLACRGSHRRDRTAVEAPRSVFT
jgi:hypothetical protein